MIIPINDRFGIESNELKVTFIRASGPGGQHVNKVSTGVQLRFDIANSPSLSAPVRARAMSLAGQRLTTDGEVVIEATRRRSQEQNRAEAIDRLVDLLRRAADIPRQRRKTRPSRAAKLRRLEHKRQRGAVKRLRRGPPAE